MSRKQFLLLLAVLSLVSISTVLAFNGGKSGSELRPPAGTAEKLKDNNKPCIHRQYPEGIVCVCNATYCDELDVIDILKTLDSDQAIIITSSELGKRWHQEIIKSYDGNATSLLEQSDEQYVVAKIEVNLAEHFQEILGFGGAITDSASRNIFSLDPKAGDLLIRSYYGPRGTDYTLGRTPMAATDFSNRVYSFDDHDGDFNLEQFSLQPEDLELKIPLIKKATELSDGKVRFFASPWSAPGWMKKSGTMVNGGPLKGKVNGKYYKTWVSYMIKFFEEYAKHGIQFWGVTMENEPAYGGNLSMGYPGMFFSPEMHRDFIRILGPALRANPATKHLKFMVYDDNRVFLEKYAEVILSDKEVASFVDGIAVHWYAWFFSSQSLENVHKTFPDKFLLATEACNSWGTEYPFLWSKNGPHLGNWTYGEYYAYNIIDDLQHFVTGWVDWNIALNETGGIFFGKNVSKLFVLCPSWVPFVGTDAPIIVNATGNEFYKQPMYHILGHFSKFIRPGMVRVGMNINDPLKKKDNNKRRVKRNDDNGKEDWPTPEDFARAMKNVTWETSQTDFGREILTGTAATTVTNSEGEYTSVVLLNTRKDVDYKINMSVKHNNEGESTFMVPLDRRSIVTVLFKQKP